MKVEIKLTEDQIKQILSQKESEEEKEVKDSGRFYPEYGEKYYRISDSKEVDSLNFNPNRDYDDIFTGNCFRTKEEAEEKGKKNIERIKAINRVNKYIDENGLRADSSDREVFIIVKSTDADSFC